MSGNKHKNYEILNLLGYGLAKFDMKFVRNFGFESKAAFYQHIVDTGVADSVGTVKNRQDLFDPFFDNGRKGWWQKGNAYIHRKKFIDSLFGEYDSKAFVDLVRLYIESKFKIPDLERAKVSPIVKSKFKQLQTTGREAELYFMENYREIEIFHKGLLEDARLFGDGYDFQIQVDERFILAEVKGIFSSKGGIRLTEKEFSTASEYRDGYSLVVVSNLETLPKMTTVLDPVQNLDLVRNSSSYEQISYHSKRIMW